MPIVVLNDGWLSLLKVKQERKGYELSGVDLGEPPRSPPHYFGVPCRGVYRRIGARPSAGLGPGAGRPLRNRSLHRHGFLLDDRVRLRMVTRASGN